MHIFFVNKFWWPTSCVPVVYLEGAIRPWPPFFLLAKKICFAIGKNRKTGFGPLCVSTSEQQKFGPTFYEILNMPVMCAMYWVGIRDQPNFDPEIGFCRILIGTD